MTPIPNNQCNILCRSSSSDHSHSCHDEPTSFAEMDSRDHDTYPTSRPRFEFEHLYSSRDASVISMYILDHDHEDLDEEWCIDLDQDSCDETLFSSDSASISGYLDDDCVTITIPIPMRMYMNMYADLFYRYRGQPAGF